MAAIFGEGKIFGTLQRVHSLHTLWVENFDEIALSHTVKEIEANLCFAILGFLRYPMGRKFPRNNSVLPFWDLGFLRYPMGRKFPRNNSILHG